MEIERKFLVKRLPAHLSEREHCAISQAYVCADPVIRVRRSERNGEERFILTVKGKGLGAHEEFELPLSRESYEELAAKRVGRAVEKTRYVIPLPGRGGRSLTAELDIFEGEWKGLRMVEVEFESEEEMAAFVPPAWFGQDVTQDSRYYNANMALSEKPFV